MVGGALRPPIRLERYRAERGSSGFGEEKHWRPRPEKPSRPTPAAWLSTRLRLSVAPPMSRWGRFCEKGPRWRRRARRSRAQPRSLLRDPPINVGGPAALSACSPECPNFTLEQTTIGSMELRRKQLHDNT
jgi:hypothetical protein